MFVAFYVAAQEVK